MKFNKLFQFIYEKNILFLFKNFIIINSCINYKFSSTIFDKQILKIIAEYDHSISLFFELIKIVNKKLQNYIKSFQNKH